MKKTFRYMMMLCGLLAGGPVFAACTCTATPSNTGGVFFQVNVSVANTGTTALSGWTVTLTFPEQVTVTTQWNASRSGANPGTEISMSI